MAQSTAVKIGTDASPDHTVKAIRIIDELRTAVLGADGEPKHMV